MDKKHYIKELEKVPGNPEVGINVLTDKGSEFWSLSKRAIQVLDNGQTVSLFQVRQRKALSARATLKVSAPAVDSIDTTLKSTLLDFCEKFEVKGDLESIGKGEEMQQFILEVLRKEIEELVRLNEDFLRLFGENPKFKKYHLIEE